MCLTADRHEAVFRSLITEATSKKNLTNRSGHPWAITANTNQHCPFP